MDDNLLKTLLLQIQNDLDVSAGLIRNCDNLDQKESLKVIGLALFDIDTLANKLTFSNLKSIPSVSQEFNGNYDFYRRLQNILNEACDFEEKKEYLEAKIKYEKLLHESQRGYFKLIAEAGLFRVINVQKDEIN